MHDLTRADLSISTELLVILHVQSEHLPIGPRVQIIKSSLYRKSRRSLYAVLEFLSLLSCQLARSRLFAPAL